MQKVEVDMQMRGYVISDDIEDVEYVDITEPAPEPESRTGRTYDKAARSAEVFKAAEDNFARLGLPQDDPMKELFVLSMFCYGAEFADEHPLSAIFSDHDQYHALTADTEAKKKESESKYGRTIDPEFNLLTALIMEQGRRWANSNPPKYY